MKDFEYKNDPIIETTQSETAEFQRPMSHDPRDTTNAAVVGRLQQMRNVGDPLPEASYCHHCGLILGPYDQKTSRVGTVGWFCLPCYDIICALLANEEEEATASDLRSQYGEQLNPAPPTAEEILEKAARIQVARGAQRDSESERSMPKCVEIFAAVTDIDMTESEGWLFMLCLKLARAQQGGYVADDYDDAVGYAALLGESAAKEAWDEEDTG